MPRWTVQYKIEKIFRDNKFTEYKDLKNPYNPNVCTVEVNRNSSEEFDKILRSNGFAFLNESVINGEINAPYMKYEIWEK